MQLCSECNHLYDSTKYRRCPHCHPQGEKIHIVWDEEGNILELTVEQYEEFKKNHKGYR